MHHQSNTSPKEPFQTINTTKVEYIKAARELPTEKWSHNLESNTANAMIVQITNDIINTLKENGAKLQVKTVNQRKTDPEIDSATKKPKD